MDSFPHDKMYSTSLPSPFSSYSYQSPAPDDTQTTHHRHEHRSNNRLQPILCRLRSRSQLHAGIMLRRAQHLSIQTITSRKPLLSALLRYRYDNTPRHWPQMEIMVLRRLHDRRLRLRDHWLWRQTLVVGGSIFFSGLFDADQYVCFLLSSDAQTYCCARTALMDF